MKQLSETSTVSLRDTNVRIRRYVIEETLRQRGITRLCHMTQIDKAIDILTTDAGILAIDFIEEGTVYQNDKDRLDGRTAHISTSVQYPNVWYYRNKKYINPKVSDWVIFLIDAEMCADDNTLFSPVNAAMGHGAFIGSEASHFSKLFADSVCGRVRTEKMLPCSPTDDQAEVLVYQNISHEYIHGMVFENEEVLWRVYGVLEEYSVPHPNLYVASALFDTCCSTLIRIGNVPEEKLVVKENKLWLKGLCS